MRPLFADRDLASVERTYSDWTATMRKLLEAAGWAVASHLDSVEFQMRCKWESTLDELTTLDFADKRVSFAAALNALETIAAETLFVDVSDYVHADQILDAAVAGARPGPERAEALSLHALIREPAPTCVRMPTTESRISHVSRKQPSDTIERSMRQSYVRVDGRNRGCV